MDHIWGREINLSWYAHAQQSRQHDYVVFIIHATKTSFRTSNWIGNYAPYTHKIPNTQKTPNLHSTHHQSLDSIMKSLMFRNTTLKHILYPRTHIYVYILGGHVPPGPNQSSSTLRLTNPFACVAISNSDSGSRPSLRTRPMKIPCYGFVCDLRDLCVCYVVVVCMLIRVLAPGEMIFRCVIIG